MWNNYFILFIPIFGYLSGKNTLKIFNKICPLCLLISLGNIDADTHQGFGRHKIKHTNSKSHDAVTEPSYDSYPDPDSDFNPGPGPNANNGPYPNFYGNPGLGPSYGPDPNGNPNPSYNPNPSGYSDPGYGPGPGANVGPYTNPSEYPGPYPIPGPYAPPNSGPGYDPNPNPSGYPGPYNLPYLITHPYPGFYFIPDPSASPSPYAIPGPNAYPNPYSNPDPNANPNPYNNPNSAGPDPYFEPLPYPNPYPNPYALTNPSPGSGYDPYLNSNPYANVYPPGYQDPYDLKQFQNSGPYPGSTPYTGLEPGPYPDSGPGSFTTGPYDIPTLPNIYGPDIEHPGPEIKTNQTVTFGPLIPQNPKLEKKPKFEPYPDMSYYSKDKNSDSSTHIPPGPYSSEDSHNEFYKHIGSGESHDTFYDRLLKKFAPKPSTKFNPHDEDFDHGPNPPNSDLNLYFGHQSDHNPNHPIASISYRPYMSYYADSDADTNDDFPVDTSNDSYSVEDPSPITNVNGLETTTGPWIEMTFSNFQTKDTNTTESFILDFGCQDYQGRWIQNGQLYRPDLDICKTCYCRHSKKQFCFTLPCDIPPVFLMHTILLFVYFLNYIIIIKFCIIMYRTVRLK